MKPTSLENVRTDNVSQLSNVKKERVLNVTYYNHTR